MFQNKIRGSALNCRSPDILAQRTRQQNHRNIRSFLLRQGQRGKRIEIMQAMIGEDQVWRMFLQFLQESLFGFHPRCVTREPAAPQLAVDQQEVLRHVFKKQYLRFAFHVVRSCFAAVPFALSR